MNVCVFAAQRRDACGVIPHVAGAKDVGPRKRHVRERTRERGHPPLVEHALLVGQDGKEANVGLGTAVKAHVVDGDASIDGGVKDDVACGATK